MRRSPLTIARYREALNWVIRDIGDLPLSTLNVEHVLSVRRNMDQRGCGEARVAAILNALRSFLRFCREGLRLAALDPREIRVPRIPRCDVLYLTKDEVERFLGAIIRAGERWEEVPLAGSGSEPWWRRRRSCSTGARSGISRSCSGTSGLTRLADITSALMYGPLRRFIGSS